MALCLRLLFLAALCATLGVHAVQNIGDGFISKNAGEKDASSSRNMRSLRSRHAVQDDVGSFSNIIGGEDAPSTRYPYMCSLRSSTHQCGGTLIAPDVLLTAAHCAGRFVEIQLGRYNRSDFDEVYETYIPRESRTHPFYYRSSAEDVDEFDFALVKFYGSSERAPLKLNRDPSLPANAGDELIIMGWGYTDPNVNETASVLQETTVDYIPNEQCKDFMSVTEDFRERIIGVSLCAIDFENGEDACQGDSGGPIVEIQNGEDVQVGVVSYGLRPCANGDYPGLYARLSYVRDWIDENVCDLSNSPPEDFGCADKMPLEPDLSGELISLTIELNGFIDPGSLGWYLESPNEEGTPVPYVSTPIASYFDLGFGADVKETVQVPNNRAYELIILDLNTDIRGAMSLYQGENVTTASIVYFDNVPLQIGGRAIVQRFDFVTGGLPTSAPSQSPAPSATFMPSSAPTMTRPFITLVIMLDDLPEETGWILEALVDENDPRIVEIFYPGTYNQSNTRIEEEIELILPGSQPIQYRFTMTDNERNGLCCENGQGFYQVWRGPAVDGEGALLFEGGEFFLEDVHTFFDTESSTLAPVVSPTTEPRTEPPSTSQAPTSRSMWWCACLVVFSLSALT